VEKLHSQNKQVLEADVVMMLGPENGEEQARAARIFMRQIPFDSFEQKKKALYDDLKEVKISHIQYLIGTEEDAEKLAELIEKAKHPEDELKGF
jgi:hypothetical protein